MRTVDKIIEFAEQIAKEDEAKMRRLQEWEDYIKPLFKDHTGYGFSLSHVSLYKKEWVDWLDIKRIEFDKL
jgi:hypothetical protein